MFNADSKNKTTCFKSQTLNMCNKHTSWLNIYEKSLKALLTYVDISKIYTNYWWQTKKILKSANNYQYAIYNRTT